MERKRLKSNDNYSRSNYSCMLRSIKMQYIADYRNRQALNSQKYYIYDREHINPFLQYVKTSHQKKRGKDNSVD